MIPSTCKSAAVAAVVLAIGLAATGCSSSTDSGGKETIGATTTAGTGPAATTAQAADLPSLLPTPSNTKTTKGPDSIADNGIHLHYQVNGAPSDVMNAYKAALTDKGWQLTTIVTSGGSGDGGGATYTGNHGDAYGVFDGGGYKTSTFIDVCVWPTKPADPNCSRGER